MMLQLILVPCNVKIKWGDLVQREGTKVSFSSLPIRAQELSRTSKSSDLSFCLYDHCTLDISCILPVFQPI